MEHRDINECICELIESLPPQFSRIVENACRDNLYMYPQPIRSEFKVNARSHSFGPDKTKICDGLLGSLVFSEMLTDGRCSAPTFSRAPIFTRKVENLFPFGDLVVKLIDQQERTVYNVTLPRHIFFPGYVKLVVIEEKMMTAVAVSGKGTGNWMLPNTVIGPLLFKSILKEHLVPKIERKIQRPSFYGTTGGRFGGGGASGRW